LAIDSQKMARVSASIAARTASGFSVSTRRADQPNLRMVLVNCWMVPP